MDMNLAGPLSAAAEGMGFDSPTDFQRRMMASILEGRNLFVRVSEERRPNMAWTLALLHLLMTRKAPEGRGPRILVLTAQRDQAMHLGRLIKRLIQDTPLRFGTIVSGRPYPMQSQLLRRPLDILIATPDRLVDHIRRGRVPLERLDALVIDKSDELLAGDSAQDLQAVLEALKGRNLQSLVLGEQLSESVVQLSVGLQIDVEHLEAPDGEISTDPVGQGAPPPALQKTEEAPAAVGVHRSRSRSHRGKRKTKHGQDPAKNEVNGNVLAAGTAQQAKPGKIKSKRGKPASGGASGTMHRHGNGRCQPGVRFPSDYVNGPRHRNPQDVIEQRRELKLNEPVQYLADYGFAPSADKRKPVTVVYRGKNRKLRGLESPEQDQD